MSSPAAPPNTVLTTARLWLRPHQADDAPFMVQLNQDPLVTQYTGDVAFESLEQAQQVVASLAQQYAQRRAGRFMVVERATGERLGFAGLKWDPDANTFDLGYRLARHAWGKGLGLEAARACVDYGWNVLHAAQLVAQAHPDNVASVRILTRLGFMEVPPWAPPDVPGFLPFRLRRTG